MLKFARKGSSVYKRSTKFGRRKHPFPWPWEREKDEGKKEKEKTPRDSQN